MKWAEGDILQYVKDNTGTALAFTANSMLINSKLNMGAGAHVELAVDQHRVGRERQGGARIVLHVLQDVAFCPLHG